MSKFCVIVSLILLFRINLRKKFKELKHAEVRVLCLTCLKMSELMLWAFLLISFHTVWCFKFASDPWLLISYMPLKKKGINVIIDTLRHVSISNCSFFTEVKFCCVDVIAIILEKQFCSNVIVFNFKCFGPGKKYREIIKVRGKRYFFVV